MKKLIMVISIISLISSFLFYGCENTTVNKNSTAIPKGSIKIWADKNEEQYLDVSIKLFKEKYKNCDIVVEKMEENQVVNKINDTNNKEFPDIFVLKEERVKDVFSINKNLFYKLSNEEITDKGNLIENNLQNLAIDGEQYGIPWYVNPALMLYREDLFSSLNISVDNIRTWRDYIDSGVELTKNKNIKLLPLIKDSISDISLSMLQELSQNFNNKGEIIVNSNDELKLGATIKTIIEKNMVKNVVSDEQQIKSFIDGEVASLIVSPQILEKIKKTAPSLKNKIKVLKLPAFENGGNRDANIRGGSILISNESKNKVLALAFLNFLTTDYNSMKKTYDAFRLLPAHYIIYSSEDFSPKDEYYGEKTWNLSVNVVKKAYNYTYSDKYEEIRSLFIKGIYNSINNKEDIRLTLDKLQGDIYNILSQKIIN